MRVAQRTGLPIVDAHRPVVDPATGTFKSGYDLNDGVHPSPTGHMAIAKSIISKGFAQLFPPNGAVHPVSHSGDTTSYLTNGAAGLFLSGAGGVGAGWGMGNSPDGWTPSLISPAVGDDLLGQWQQIQRDTSGTKDGWLYSTLSGLVSNNLYELSFRFQTEGFDTATGPSLAYAVYARWTSPNQSYGIIGWTRDVADGRIVARVRPTISGGAGYLNIQCGYPATGGPVKLRVGEVSFRNLTALGIS